jgi:hypothetical protein
MLLWSLVANAMIYPNAEERATAHVRLWHFSDMANLAGDGRF